MKASAVNCAPWSVLKILGRPWLSVQATDLIAMPDGLLDAREIERDPQGQVYYPCYANSEYLPEVLPQWDADGGRRRDAIHKESAK